MIEANNNRNIVEKKWIEAETEIREIYNVSKLCAYKSYDFLKIVGIGKLDKNLLATLGMKEQTLLLYTDSVCQVIAPFYTKKEHGIINIYFRGSFTSAGQLDLIYRDTFTDVDFAFLIDYLKKQYNRFRIHFERIKYDSLTYIYAQKYSMRKLHEDIMVSIPLQKTYEQWFKGLSKSVRQNIRTSYNRLNTDGHTLDYTFFEGEKKPDKDDRKEMIRLFSKRMGQHMGKDSKILEKAIYMLKLNHPMTRGLFDSPDHVEGIIRIDGVLAAFFSGVTGMDNRMLIARLSIDTDYGRYSPGGLLINETMKIILKEESKFKEFDLQRGDEQYKYSYGGCEYKSYSWILEEGLC